MATLSRYTVAVVLDGDDTQLAALWKRAGVKPLRRDEMDRELRTAGFEPQPYATNVKMAVWPLTALVYRSPSKDGKGRSGSTLYRVRCRRADGRRDTLAKEQP